LPHNSVLMEEAFEKHENVVSVIFNPWRFQSEAHLLGSFFTTLADVLGKALTTKIEDVGTLFEKYGSLLSVASINIFGGLAQVDLGKGVQSLGDSLSTVELDELKERIEKVLMEADKRIVVLIDDIDRLDRQEIQAIFKLVKLSADFENTTYVLAFDEEVVADALGEKYGSGDIEAGRSFLEKIIQVPLHLPPAGKMQLRKAAFEGIDAALDLSGIQLDQDKINALVRQFIDGFEVCLVTPRQAKRYANALLFALPLLKGEVNPVDQILLEGIRIFYPRLYRFIRVRHEVIFSARRTESHRQQEKDRIGGDLEGAIENLTQSEKDSAKELLQIMFPWLKNIFGNMSYGSEWDKVWSKEQRICSEKYFHRYFQYAIPVGDVSD